MKNELCGCSSRQTDADSMSYDQNYGKKCLHNVSLQTGEEFSPEFLRDRMSRRTPFVNNNVDQVPTSSDVGQNQHVVYKDLTGHVRIRRRDSESFTEFPDFGSAKEYGYDVDYKTYFDGTSRYYREFQHQRKFSDDFDRASPSGPSIYSSDSPNSHQLYNKGSGNLDRSLSGKMKFLCSFGGRILPRPNDGKLRFVGGETRIISIGKNVTYHELMEKTTAVCNYLHTIKYQLPGEDLDALISVSSDEDLHHMIEEYHDSERNSQRLRLFLVSLADLDSPSSLEASTMQQSDPNHQYVVAVNSMMDPSPHKSSSRESLESQWGSNFDDSPNLPSDGSSLHLKVKSYVPSPLLSHAPFRDPDSSYVKGYEDVICPYAYNKNCPYVMDTPQYENTCCVDASSYYYNHPMDTLPVIGSPNKKNYMGQLHATPTVGSHFRFLNAQDTFSFSPMSDVHAKSYRRVTNVVSESKPSNDEKTSVPLEGGTEKTILTFAEEICSSSQRLVDQQIAHEKCQETSNLDKDYIEWSKDTIKWMKNKEPFFDQDWKNYATKNDCVSNANFLKHKQNLPKIICRPDTKMSAHVPTSELHVNVTKNLSSLSDSAENPTEVVQELPRNYNIGSNKPEFIIKSQNLNSDIKCYIDDAVDCSTAFFAAEGDNNQSRFMGGVILPEDVPCRIFQEDSSIKNDTSVNSDKFRETQLQKMPVIVEDVTDKLPPDVLLSSEAVPHIQEKHSDVIESPGEGTEVGSLVYASEDDDVKGDEDNKDASLSDAAIIEMEAGIYGLQIIRNADLEDLQELGSGTYGTVYHGKWRGTDVAIKRIKKSCFAGRSSEQEKLTKDFWREAKILSRLHHPNIVAFYGVVPDGPGGTLATVTEYMANGSLRHVLLRKDHRTLDRRKKVIIALDAAFGMEYLHLKNIVHFDLKCDNLLVNLGDPQRPVCKVGDFGLSRIKQNTLVSGGVRGTLPWMAPELLNGCSSRVSEKVDVFSFGIAMWEILTGEEPYLNMHCGAIIGGIVNNTLRPPIPERCDPGWRKLMEECWSHDPSARPSFTEITNRLQVMSTALQPKRFNRVKR
ncbi:Tyrosine kinase [Handroanthus impetiginosus]|uniref:Tyrosine kinase n=1 Tax=Handroanthus impetiginosus TaxID=429701 RepID=A0A2G9HDF0_9LAMI|nr:Tyrosine kinase [Handroanthus impetiginosus]